MGGSISCDVWAGRFQSICVARNRIAGRACAANSHYLEGEAQPHITMCGRDSVQIHERRRKLDLGELGRRLASAPSADGAHTMNFFCVSASRPMR